MKIRELLKPKSHQGLLGNLSQSNHAHSHSIRITEILLDTAKSNEMEVRPPTDNWTDALGSEKLYTSGTDHLKNKINFLYKTWEIFFNYMENLPSHMSQCLPAGSL